MGVALSCASPALRFFQLLAQFPHLLVQGRTSALARFERLLKQIDFLGAHCLQGCFFLAHATQLALGPGKLGVHLIAVARSLWVLNCNPHVALVPCNLRFESLQLLLI